MAERRTIEAAFPNIAARGYTPTSAPSTDYNCIAWALYDTKQWWTPARPRPRGYYWPPGIKEEWTVEQVAAVFALHQYTDCHDATLETEFERIAIFADSSGEPQHVARQLADGAWTSKLGGEDDIEHSTLDALSGGDFGSVVKFMKRPRRG